MMNWKAVTLLCGASLVPACSTSMAQAQVVVVGGIPSYGTPVVVARPVVPALPVLPAPAVVASPYLAPTYSAGFGVYSTYRPVMPTTYVAPAPVVSYRPTVPTYVPTYYPARPGVVTSRVYYPGQPLRNALRVVAP